MNKKSLLKAVSLLITVLMLMFVLVILAQYKQLDYIISGKTVAATVTEIGGGTEKAKVIYINQQGDEVNATAILKESAEVGDNIYLLMSKRHADVLYQIPSRAMIIVFDLAFVMCEVIGWMFVMKLLRKLKKYKKLEKKGIKTSADITAVKNTSGILGADIEFVDQSGNKRTTVYYPTSDIPSAGDKIEIIYYIKRTGKIVFIVPKDE